MRCAAPNWEAHIPEVPNASTLAKEKVLQHKHAAIPLHKVSYHIALMHVIHTCPTCNS
jgi:hypothetical protein